MSRALREQITQKILDLIRADEVDYQGESWETSSGRYTDEARFEAEREQLFLNRPQLAAFSADLPNPGDYYATSIAGRPILLARDSKGMLRAFMNACRHRGVQLADGCGNTSGFTCPYHGWTYGSDGILISVPSQKAFDPRHLENRSLIQLPVSEKVGLILVHPDQTGIIDFDEFLGPIQSLVADCQYQDLRFLREYRASVPMNWKLAVDGMIEAYHVPYLHSTTVGLRTLPQFVHLDFGFHQLLASPGPEILELRNKRPDEWPEFPFYMTTAIFPNTIIGGGGYEGGYASFQRSDPGDRPGSSDYIFRLYAAGKEPVPGIAEQQEMVAALLMETQIDEDLRAHISAQKMMDAGVVPSIVFGAREPNISRRHRLYDQIIGANEM